jgi:hypothetical protein
MLHTYFCAGEMAERSNAAVLKTVEVKASGGSNPSLSAKDRAKKSKTRAQRAFHKTGCSPMPTDSLNGSPDLSELFSELT